MWKLNLSEYNRTNLSLWLMLSFQAGIVNAGGFLACHRFVTHTTGFATQFGTEFAQGHWIDAIGMVSVPVFYMLGSMFSAFFVDRQLNHNREPKYSFLALGSALILATISFLGESGSFGKFGDAHDIRLMYSLIAMLCFVSGVQNAAITSASGAIIRTTHLTGLTTDLGIGIVRSFDSLLSASGHFRRDLQAASIRALLIGGFVMGSTFGAFLFLQQGYWGFLIPAALSFFLYLVSLRYSVKARHRKLSNLQNIG